MRGFVPQYEVAAERIYAAITAGALHSVGLADPEAETLDDIQVVRRVGSGLVLDAYQVKWSLPGATFSDSEFRNEFAALVKARAAVVEASVRRQKGEPGPVIDRVVAHFYTSRVPSTTALRGTTKGSNRNLHAFLDSVWRRAQLGLAQTLEELDASWHPYLTSLAQSCGLEPEELLALASDLQIETGQRLESEGRAGDDLDRRFEARIEDIKEIRSKLQDLVRDPLNTYVWISADQLVGHLGRGWAARWRPRHSHVFPTPDTYEPLSETAERLEIALDEHNQGYVVVTGSPGSGKSTLLTNHLRADARVAARYYAFVPGGETVTRGEATAFLHDLFLEIAGTAGLRVPAPRGDNLDLLRDAFREELARLAIAARTTGATQIIVIDGLDHVERDPRPQQSLLRELLTPEEIPDGVLFVIGTRGLADLPSHVTTAVGGPRHVPVAPLARAAVHSLAQRAGLEPLGDKIFELSAGHPLLTRTYLSLARSTPPEARTQVLSESPASNGEIWTFYARVWEKFDADPDLVELLGLLCRLRGPVRVSWLLRTGSRTADLRRLAPIEFLFSIEEQDRWSFFHTSFREFLREHTARLAGRFSEEIHRQYHRKLAERCSLSRGDDPERFDQLFHLVEAGRPEEVLAAATPEYFRAQLDDMRPQRAVGEDIRLAATAIAAHNDPLALLRLALAGNELQTRRHQLSDTEALAKLLISLEQADLAVAHVHEIETQTANTDRTSTALKVAVHLHVAGHETAARQLFERYEPLEWFGARASEQESASYNALHSWAEAATALRGADYVIGAVRSLRAPEHREVYRSSDAESMAQLGERLLWDAALTSLDARRYEEVSRLRDTLAASDSSLASALDAYIVMEFAPDVDTERIKLAAVDWEALSGWPRFQAVERLVALDPLSGAELFDRLNPPPVPTREYMNAEREDDQWEYLFMYWRLAARLGRPADAATVYPDTDSNQQAVVAARHVVGMATLEGRAQAGQIVEIIDVITALRAMHRFWKFTPGDHNYDRPVRAHKLISGRAIALARSLGDDAVAKLVAYLEVRWENEPGAIWMDGADLVQRLADCDAGHLTVQKALIKLEALASRDGTAADDWVAIGAVWAGQGDSEAAGRCARNAFRSTLVLTSEHETQIATWMPLLLPLLNGTDGERLAYAMADALDGLGNNHHGGSPELAATALLRLTLPEHPLRAWALAEQFLDSGLLAPDAVIVVFLEVASAAASDHWWVVLAELLVALGSTPPETSFDEALQADPARAVRNLATLLLRVSVEGRPTARASWFKAVRGAALQAGKLSELEALTSSEERHQLAQVDTAAPEKSPPTPVQELLDRLESSAESHDYLRLRPADELISRIIELKRSEVDRLERCLEGTDREPAFRAALSEHASTPAEAWAQGLRGIATSEAADWSRRWAGGPMIQLLPRLTAIDQVGALGEAYRALAGIASTVDYFLGETVSGSLPQFARMLGAAEEETAREVLGAMGALIRNVAELPTPAELNAGKSPSAPVSDIDDAFERLIGWFLRARHFVAWQAAQRTTLELLERSRGQSILRTALAGTGPEVLRACAVVAAAIERGLTVATLVPDLEALSSSASVTHREAAAVCLRALSTPVPPSDGPRTLPPALRLRLSVQPASELFGSGIARTAEHSRPAIEALARAAQIDSDALFEHVLAAARRQNNDPDGGDEKVARRSSMLGWGFIKPSAEAVRKALTEAAASLVDAGQLSQQTALAAIRETQPFDAGLIVDRPERRPRDIRTFIAPESRASLYRVPIDEIAASPTDRLARTHDGWIVIGERTDVRLADRAGHRETRWSGAIAGSLDEDAIAAAVPFIDEDGAPFSHGVQRSSRFYLAPGAPPFRGMLLMRSRLSVFAASPDNWLAMHPVLARDMGLEPSQHRRFEWLADGQPVVRSIWWRSGYTQWQPYSDADEVGEGWLVTADPSFLELWRRRLGLTQVWAVATERRGDGDSDPPGLISHAGIRPVSEQKENEALMEAPTDEQR